MGEKAVKIFGSRQKLYMWGWKLPDLPRLLLVNGIYVTSKSEKPTNDGLMSQANFEMDFASQWARLLDVTREEKKQWP